MHSKSCTHVSWLKGEDNTAQVRYTNWVENYLTEKEIQNKEVWQALRTNQWRLHHPRLYFLQEKISHPFATSKEIVKFLARKILPASLRKLLKKQWQGNNYSLNANQ